MRYQAIGMYVIILCIIFSIGIRNDSQIVKDTGFRNQVEQKQIKQNNTLQNTILTKINTKQEKRQSDLIPARSQTVTTVKASSNVTGFISTWQTNITNPTSSKSNQIDLPLVSNGIYDFNVSWGDGNANLITKYNQSTVTHTYSSLGIYTVNITGTIVGWRFNGSGDAVKLLEISNWGPLRLGNAGYYFSGALNLGLDATDTLDLNGTTDLAGMFENCQSLGNSVYSENLNSWNVSQVTDMSGMFSGATTFNQPLESWNVSRVTDMSLMFYGAFKFDHPLDSWNVSRVTDTRSMFAVATTFNEPLNSWNVLQITDMSGMFADATTFNQPLNSWNVSQVTDMSYMFEYATTFNQPLNSWNVSRVTEMSSMFAGATTFNQRLNSWNISQVTDMSNMFAGISLSISNYDKLLLGWSSLPNLRHKVVFNAGNSQYSTSAQNARDRLIKKFDWTIMDGGLSEISFLTSNGLTGLIFIVFISVIGFSAYVTIAYLGYLEYKKTQSKEYKKKLKFWFYFRNSFLFKRHNKIAKESLSSETFEKIKQIIEENKE